MNPNLSPAIINNVTIAIVTILVEIKVIIGVTPDPLCWPPQNSFSKISI